MKNYKLQMYETDIEVYEISDAEVDIKINGLAENVEKIALFAGGVYVAGDRTQGAYYAEGYSNDKGFIVLASGIDQKQLRNVLASLGAESGTYVAIEEGQVTVAANKPDYTPLTDSLKEVIVAKEAPEKTPPRKRSRKK